MEMAKILAFLRSHNYFLFDLYIFIFIVSYAGLILSNNFLIQDKICLIVYNQTKYFCRNINKDIFHGEEAKIKDRILSSSALYNNYNNILQVVPMLIYSLFLGSFIDRYVGATRIIFAWMNFVNLFINAFYLFNIYNYSLSPYFLLFNSISQWLHGGMATFLTCTNRFVVHNTDPKYRVLRFTLFQINLVIALSIGGLIGGNVIKFLDDQHEQLRNYDVITWITTGFQLILFIMILLMRVDRIRDVKDGDGDDNDKKSKLTHQPNEADVDVEENINNPSINGKNYSSIITSDNSDDSGDMNRNQNQNNSKKSRWDQFKHILRTFLDIENVRDTFRSLFKKRENKGRSHIVVVIILLFLIFTNYLGLDQIFLSFSQKVYQFDAQMYSLVSSFSKIVPTVLLLLSSYLFINLLKLDDGTLLALTISTGVISQTMIGTFTNAYVYLSSLVVGAPFGLSSIVIKAKVPKIVPEDEIGKIFSLVSILESLAPLLGTLLFSTIFSQTVSYYPTLIYHTAAFITLFCLLLALFEDLYYKALD